MYGYSKHLFDLYASRSGISKRIVGLKYFNVYGPNENHKGDMRSVVNKAFDQIRATGKVQLFKSHRPDYRDGEQQRDFLYVKDAVNMTKPVYRLADRHPLSGGNPVQSGFRWKAPHSWLQVTGECHFRRAQIFRRASSSSTCRSICARSISITPARTSGDDCIALGYKDALTPPLDAAVADYVRNYLAQGKLLGD